MKMKGEKAKGEGLNKGRKTEKKKKKERKISTTTFFSSMAFTVHNKELDFLVL